MLCTDQFETSSSPRAYPGNLTSSLLQGSSREFDVLGLPCGGAFDNGVGICPFSRASCMHRKYFALAANTVFSDFEDLI
jgi:hypothetical protein